MLRQREHHTSHGGFENGWRNLPPSDLPPRQHFRVFTWKYVRITHQPVEQAIGNSEASHSLLFTSLLIPDLRAYVSTPAHVTALKRARQDSQPGPLITSPRIAFRVASIAHPRDSLGCWAVGGHVTRK